MRYDRQADSGAASRFPAGLAIHTCPGCGRPHHFHALVPGDHSVCTDCLRQRNQRPSANDRRGRAGWWHPLTALMHMLGGPRAAA